jgi:hypothetical protein
MPSSVVEGVLMPLIVVDEATESAIWPCFSAMTSDIESQVKRNTSKRGMNASNSGQMSFDCYRYTTP